MLICINVLWTIYLSKLLWWLWFAFCFTVDCKCHGDDLCWGDGLSSQFLLWISLRKLWADILLYLCVRDLDSFHQFHTITSVTWLEYCRYSVKQNNQSFIPLLSRMSLNSCRDNILHAPRIYSWGKFWYLHAVMIY